MTLRSRVWLIPTLLSFGLVLVASVILGASRGLMWAGEWAWTVDWANGLTLAGGPFAAAVAAVIHHRYQDTGLGTLARQSVRGVLLLPILLSGVGLGAVAAWLSTSLALVAITATRSPLPPRHLEWLVVGAITMFGYVAAGAFVARIASRAWAAPVAFIVTFGLSSLAASGSVPPLFRVGGSAGTLAGQLVSWPFIAWAALVHVLLVTLALSAVTSSEAVRPTMLRVVAGAAAAGLLAALAFAVVRPVERIVADEGVSFRCAGTVVKTCMAADTSSQLDQMARAMDVYARELRQLDLDLPGRFVQELPGVRGSEADGLLSLPAQEINTGSGLGLLAAESVTVPATCPQYFGAIPPESALQAQAIMAAYLRFRLDPQGFPAPPGTKLERWMNGPAERWLVDTYPKLRTCALADVTVPDV